MPSRKRSTAIRLDDAIIHASIADSSEMAVALVLARRILVDGSIATKPGQKIRVESTIELIPNQDYVGRGGIKLNQALEDFRVDVSNGICLDVGASTGGFTDCLLKRGASRVYAVDVGYGQLDYNLRIDDRVISMERTNARFSLDIPEKVDFITIDVSFISIKNILPSVIENIKPNGSIIALIKPQFEADKGEVARGGVIRDPILHASILARMIDWLVNNNYRILNLVRSPLTGDKGNKEFFVLIRHEGNLVT
ncbi:MAG: TlyA family RNA methyltransferase [SAR202 cluster bacterium]|nr:TlyA family RNA methyltransferase [SAR202 cluster bacterium]|tara:strand:- start:575 stop:1333 length:759 start_codon:yes stop_codon:yes gene_type:complete